jgi:hypothetical protein
VERRSELRRLWRKTKQHWVWAREQGLRRLIEEDELNPLTRVPAAWGSWRWSRFKGVTPGHATPVYVVGAQRSGTNLFVRVLKQCSEFRVYNENNRRAFHDFRLRSDDVIASIVRASRHRYVVFKAPIDSHRVVHLLDHLPVPTAGRAIWIYRNVDDRVRSAVNKFGNSNLRALADISAGATDRWESGGLEESKLELIRSFDYRKLTPVSGSALFWYLRNSLFFDLSLDSRPDVIPLSYDRLVTDPESATRLVCAFLGFSWEPRLVAGIEVRRAAGRALVEIDPAVRAMCDALQARLDAAFEATMRETHREASSTVSERRSEPRL